MLLLLRMIIIKRKNSWVKKNDNVKEIKAVTTDTESTGKTKIIDDDKFVDMKILNVVTKTKWA